MICYFDSFQFSITKRETGLKFVSNYNVAIVGSAVKSKQNLESFTERYKRKHLEQSLVYLCS